MRPARSSPRCLCSRAPVSTSQRQGTLHPTSKSRFGFGHITATQQARRCNATDITYARTPPEHPPVLGDTTMAGGTRQGRCLRWPLLTSPACGKGLALPPPTRMHIWKTGQKGLAGPSDAKAKGIQTSPSVAEIIPKEERTPSVSQGTAAHLLTSKTTHTWRVHGGVKQHTEAKKAPGAADEEGIAFVSATVC